ncbi:MAG: NFACT family protein [Lachnospiraceae bacterium]|nr:NFACT family protein [Lachnospiraceae bacterium]
MAFDGIVVANLVAELNQTILNGRISKIAQPEADELLLTIKTNEGARRLALSASASLPFVYLTDSNKPSPMTAPLFCMVLRKHIANGRITAIRQPGLERIIQFEIEHLDEMGDLCKKLLIIELMGKYSNIIFCENTLKIIDSIKRVPAQVSSVREVLPGRNYFIPDTQSKLNPLTVSQEQFFDTVCEKPMSLSKALVSSFTGISTPSANEICHRASLDADDATASLSADLRLHFYHVFDHVMNDIRENHFSPCIIYQGDEPVDFSALLPTQYQDLTIQQEFSISVVLETYYAKRNSYTRIRQKSADLRRHITTLLERNQKKLVLQEKQMKDTEKKDKYKIYGELLNTYGYQAVEGASSVEVLNYYTNQPMNIPLDPTLSPLLNAQKYFARYNKLKRTAEALSTQLEGTRMEIAHLESILNALDIAETEDDLSQIREELVTYGYLRRKNTGKKKSTKSKPFHYRSSDGFDIYVGKNNFQNDELTFKFANGGDWWFHAKGMPGSHVIVRTEGKELPDATFEEAARLAGYYSKGRDNEKVEIDYLQRKNVKKPNGAVAGYVIYYTNYSMAITPDIKNIEKISE